jgi:6-pyruvoyltetrahydropterin/6-carboxytetrahydropterin synthase
MYEVVIRKRFAAAHQLRGYGGQCENLHGHNWIVDVGVEGTELDDVGLLLDFKILKNHVDDVFEELDHKYLNDHEWFKTRNPSSEHLSRYLHDQISARLDTPGLTVSFVRVWESDDAAATYRVG